MDYSICQSLYDNYKELGNIFTYVRNLEFFDEPDYDYINKLFLHCFKIQNINVNDFEFKKQ